MNALEFFRGNYRFAVRRVFCCVSCCSALVNALRAVLSDSVTELSLFRASEMALSFRVCCPSRRACCASRTARAAPPFFPALTTACPEYLFCARIQQAYQRPSCLRSAHPSAVFQPVRLTTRLAGRYTKRISISKQHPALYAAGGHHIRRFQYGIRILSALPAGV